MRFIDADMVEYFKTFNPNKGEKTIADMAWRSDIDAIPTADVAPVVHWEWKNYKPLDEDGNIINGLGSIFRCSLCGEEVLFEPCNYCPNCGADMRGENNELHKRL